VSPGALAPWAADPARSRGRRIPEPPSPPRNEHQRDRDRIVHSTGFRRLVYKTQVFVNHEGDLFRTRLTHSLEVAQLARSAARALQLNEDLVEAIALAHDLGHTPFGHAGQDALHACMREHGGFEHNLQSLRVVDLLETRYAAFDGLNLSYETREGILKHCARRQAEALCAAEPGHPAQRFLDRSQPSLEAQLVDLCDAMAYNTHDIDDGVRSGLLQPAQLAEVGLYTRLERATLAEYPALVEPAAAKRLLAETLRRMLATLMSDLMAASSERIAAEEGVLRTGGLDAVRSLPPLMGFSERVTSELAALKRFLFASLYRHPQVSENTARARQVVSELFAAYRQNPAELPTQHAEAAVHGNAPRAITDYIAGMTDRFALREHQRLTGQRVFPDAAAAGY
jgi:dGTPase